ncbi:MAG: MMPL family transporter [Bacteroidia bacterium]
MGQDVALSLIQPVTKPFSARGVILTVLLAHTEQKYAKKHMHLILKYKGPLLVLLLGITGVLAWGLSRLEISFSFDSFYPKQNPEYQYYMQFQHLFTEDQNYMVYVALRSPAADVFDRVFLQRADSVFAALGALPGVDSLLSPTTFPQIRRRGLGISARPYLQFDSDSAVVRSRARCEADTSLRGLFITRDEHYLCGYLFIEPAIFDTRARDDLSDDIDEVLTATGMTHLVSGIPYIRTRYVRTISQELLLFLSLSLLLITAVLFLTYRNFWGVAIPMLCVVVALVWILGFMGATGQSINLISNMLIPIMFVVGTSDVIHITTKYLNELRTGQSRFRAMGTTLREIGLAIFLTSATTAIGFASLIISKMPPIRQFGLYAAIGVIFTYLITVIILPNALLWLPERKLLQVRSMENLGFWRPFLGRIDIFTQRHSRAILLAFAGIMLVSLLLIPSIPTESYLIEDIGRKDPTRQAMEFFEQQSYGLRPFELGIHLKRPGSQITDQAVLAELARMETWLRSRYPFGPILSPATIVSEANALYHFNRPEYRRIPDTQAEIDELLSFAQAGGGGELLSRVVSEDERTGRISSRLPDMGTHAFDRLYAGLDSFTVQHCDTSLFSYRTTGHAYLTEHNLRYVRRSLLGGLGIAFVVIGAIMGLLFRSWKMLIISLIPNIVPLVLTGGVMGLFGINLTASTALVFVIAFGIAVDDTIHFLTRYRQETDSGKDVDQALAATMMGTGKAMIITSLILLGGFILLLASDFGGTYNTGLFTGLTVVFALLADLLLLPVLVRWAYRTQDNGTAPSAPATGGQTETTINV